jgi:hypothetical protein
MAATISGRRLLPHAHTQVKIHCSKEYDLVLFFFEKNQFFANHTRFLGHQIELLKTFELVMKFT